MIKLLRKYCAGFLLLVMFSCENQASDFQVYGLQLNQPFETSKHQPATFSWKIKSETNNWTQSAYQIIVSGSEKNISENIGDLWDSKKIIADNQLYIPYGGKGLANGEKYYWKVKVWENSGTTCRWSKAESFVTPLAYPHDWKAQWITYDYKKESPMPLLRKSFQINQEKKVVAATLFICGLGYYEAYLNGTKIGDRVLEPAQTNYDDYALYTKYEIPVSEILQKNTLGVMLGNGWYNQNLVWNPAMSYGQPIVIAQLIIKYKNGRPDTINTDNTWKWKEGPVIFNNIYAGEVYNSNLEITNWNRAGFTDNDWKPVKFADVYPPEMKEEYLEPIRRMGSLSATRILEPSDKKWVFDFGQNFAGWVRLKVMGKKGQKITLRFSEEVDESNNINPSSTGVLATKYVQTDQYICKGAAIEIWEPRFTYHGFRYVEVTGLDNKPEKDLLTGIVVYSSMRKAGEFSCSDAQINKLHDLALWTIKSNMHGIPTDCPHRERCGWTGDAHTVAPTLIQNLDARLFLTKYLYDMRSSAREIKNELYFGANFHDRSVIQKPAGVPTMIVPGKRTSGIASPDWGTAVTQIPWNLYLNYGDLKILSEFYPDMKTWVDYIADKFPDYIVSHGLGDWCPPGGNTMIDCPVSLSSTAFHYLDLSVLTKIAYLLGYSSDASYYFKRLNKVKERFNGQFFNAEKNSYGSQTANAMAIQFGLVPKGKTSEVVKSLVTDITTKSNGFIQTGIFGLGRIFPALAENGAEDLAYELFTKTGNHSFAKMWQNYDATTLWEILPVDDFYKTEGVNKRSRNHPMNAGYDEWFFRGIAGIHLDEMSPGYKNIVFRPYFISKLKYAGASYESPFGTIASNWKWEGKTFRWDITIPANCNGDFYIPKLSENQRILINGRDEGLNLKEDPSFPGFLLCKSPGNGNFHLTITPQI